MIISITLNPAIDHTIVVENLKIGSYNQILDERKDPSGKGINVSRVLHSLGKDSLSLGFLGGKNGDFISEKLNSLGIYSNFTQITGETRENIKIIDKSSFTNTDINQKGPNLTSQELSKFMKTLNNNIHEGDFVIISGSVPPNFDLNDLKKILNTCKQEKTKIFIDSSGEILKEAIKNDVFLVKPNLDELEEITGKILIEMDERIKECQKIVQGGVSNVLLSMGEEGALFVNQDHVIHAYSVPIKIKSATGAGDALLAGFIYGLSQKMDIQQCLVIAIAAAGSSCMMEGTQPGSLILFKELQEKIEIKSYL